MRTAELPCSRVAWISEMSNLQFYANLPSFEDFPGVAQLDQYAPLPENWVILCSDVVESTLVI